MASNPSHLLARLRFRHLQLIDDVDRTGSLSRSAENLNLTQPALSKALKEVEDMVGFAIFDRGPRGLQKTAQGKVVVAGASLLLRELAHVCTEANLAGSVGDMAGLLRLGTSAFLALSLLPPVIARLTRMSPPLAVSLQEGNVPHLLASLMDGDLDALVALYNRDLMAQTPGRSVRFERLSEEPYVVIAPRGHRLLKPRVRASTWQALAEEPWILTRRPSLARVLLEDCFRRDGVYLPDPICETDGPVTAARMVAEGVGLSSVPASTALALQATGEIGYVRLKTQPPGATLGLIYRADSAAHPRVALLREALGLA